MSILDFLRRRREKLEDNLSKRGMAHTLSLARFRLHQHISKAIIEDARGVCLDAGSGRSPYRKFLEQKCTKVVGIDVENRDGRVDVIADLQNMPEIPDESCDTVLCSQVLEHVAQPWLAIEEIARVLRPGGVLILTAPHLSVIHEAPHDYFRFTAFAIGEQCVAAGLEIRRLRPTGGLVCFLSHGVSAAWMSVLGTVPFINWIAWALNAVAVLIVFRPLDRLVGIQSLYPCDHIAIASKLPTR